MEFYADMKKRKVEPDLYIYNTLLHATTKQKLPEAVSYLLEDMKKTGIEPDLVSYNTLLVLENDPMKILEEMESKNILPDIKSYSSILTGCKDLKIALKVLELTQARA
jgi:pentatricopeptide repeat domain-containing protein 1